MLLQIRKAEAETLSGKSQREHYIFMFCRAAEGFSLWVLNLRGLRLAGNIFDHNIFAMSHIGQTSCQQTL